MSVLERLVEIFPAIDENFLKGLCDVYKDEPLEFDEFIDVILSYEHPPLKENCCNETQTEYFQNNDIVDQVPENLPPKTSDDSNLSTGIVTASAICENEVYVNEVLVQASSSNVGTTIDVPIIVLDDDLSDSCIKILDPPYTTSAGNYCVKPTSSKISHDSVVKTAFSVTNTILDVVPKSSSKNVVLQNTNEINSSQLNTKLPRDIVGNTQFNGPCGSKKRYQRTRRNSSSSDSSDSVRIWSSKVQIRKSPSSSRLKSLHLSRIRARQITFRSSKIKTQEHKLKAKLLRPKRLHLKKEYGSCVTNFKSLSQSEKPENELICLSKILPNEYLSKQSGTITSHKEEPVFISQSGDNSDHLKQKYNLKKTVKMEKFDCTVDEFLQETPDPEQLFSSDNYIRTGYEGNAEIYLQSRYQHLSSIFIKELLVNNKYNLTKVCQLLDFEGQEISTYTLENLPLQHAASVFFCHEVWYIEHKHVIRNVLESAIKAAQVEADLERPPTPPPVVDLFECEICREEVDYTDLGTCDGQSGHLFCKSCIRRNTEVKIGEGATTFPCLNNCGGVIPIQTIEEILPAQTFAILMNKIQEEQVRSANIPGVEICPFCPYAYGPEDLLFVCSNPSCGKISCRACKKEDHSPDICQLLKEEDEETARHFIEDRMTEALVRVCYKCGKQFVKDYGCNKMTCSCGAIMCYVCRQPVRDYSHFKGQGNPNSSCELYSDDVAVHARPVAASAQQALAQLKANNPGLQLDPNKVLPKPGPTKIRRTRF